MSEAWHNENICSIEHLFERGGLMTGIASPRSVRVLASASAPALVHSAVDDRDEGVHWEAEGNPASEYADARSVKLLEAIGRALDGRGSWGRRILVLVLVVMLSSALVGLTSLRAQSYAGPQEVATYIVKPGESLWSYASAITPEGGNVSDSVERLEELNQMSSADLKAGDRIMVPVNGS